MRNVVIVMRNVVTLAWQPQVSVVDTSIYLSEQEELNDGLSMAKSSSSS